MDLKKEYQKPSSVNIKKEKLEKGPVDCKRGGSCGTGSNSSSVYS